MAYYVKLWLIVSGIGTFICLAFPGIVVIGMFLILPGLILSLMPTAFLWGCAFALIWFPAQAVLNQWLAALLAAGATFALFWFLPASSVAASGARLAEAVKEDMLPAEPIRLRGHVRVDLPWLDMDQSLPPGPDRPRQYACNALCAAILFTEGVESVTVARAPWQGNPETIEGPAPLDEHARTFRLVPRDACRATIRPRDAAGLGETLEDARALAAEWDLRLSTKECIIADPPRRDFDLLISHREHSLFYEGEKWRPRPWSFGPGPVMVNQLEIRSGGGALLLRKLLASTEALVRPLLIAPSGGIQNFRFGWVRRKIGNGGRYEELKPVDLLRAHTDLDVTVDKAGIARATRARLAEVSADPSVPAEDPAFAMLESYFSLIKSDGFAPEDRVLLPAVIRDRRFTGYNNVWDAIRAMGDEAALLRAPIVERLAASTWEKDRDIKSLGRALDSLPEGLFAEPIPAELALLADPDARRLASGLIFRQADRGAAAVPLLLEIMADHGRRHRDAAAEKKRYASDDGHILPIDAARVALCRLGPEGAVALGPVEKLAAEGLVPRNIVRDRTWHHMLIRLGKPIEQIAKPANMSGSEENYRRHLREWLGRFRPDRCGAQWS